MNTTGGWEQRDGRLVCRWMIVWQNLDGGSFCGAVAGYSGGGAFQLERFYAKHSDGELTSLMIDLEDKVSGDEIDFFDDVPDEIRAQCDDCEDIIVDWHDRDEWEEAEQLLLNPDNQDQIEITGDLGTYNNAETPFAKEILAGIGATASP